MHGQRRGLAAASRQADCHGCAGNQSAQQAGDADAVARRHQLEQDIAEKADAADQHHHQPDAIGVEHVKRRRTKAAIWQQRQDNGGDGGKLERGVDVLARDLLRKAMHFALEREQCRRCHADSRRQQHIIPVAERTGQKGQQRRHFSGQTDVVAPGNDIIGDCQHQPQHEQHGDKGQRRAGGRRRQRRRTADQCDQRKGAHTGEQLRVLRA